MSKRVRSDEDADAPLTKVARVDDAVADDDSIPPIFTLVADIWHLVTKQLTTTEYVNVAGHTCWPLRRLLYGVESVMTRFMADAQAGLVTLDQFRAFVSTELDVAFLFNIASSSVFHAALAKTEVAAVARRCAPLESVVLAGGAPRAAFIEALRSLDVAICPRLLATYADFDYWLDVNQMPAETLARVMQQIAAGGQEQQTILEITSTVLVTEDRRLQFCAWDGAYGHTCQCHTPHGGCRRSNTTPIACFDLTAIQCALSGSWFTSPTAGQPPPPFSALCTRLAAYALLTGRCYMTQGCHAADWPFDGTPLGTPTARGRTRDGTEEVPDFFIWSANKYRLFRRCKRFAERGHTIMAHPLTCYALEKPHFAPTNRDAACTIAESTRSGPHGFIMRLPKDAEATGEEPPFPTHRWNEGALDMSAVDEALALPDNIKKHPPITPTRLVIDPPVGLPLPEMYEEGYKGDLSTEGTRVWDAALWILRERGLA